MNWTGRLTDAKETLEDILKPFLTKVREVVGPAALAAAKDDAAMTKILDAAYLVLPMPVRLLVSKEKFVRFCLANRDALLAEPKGVPEASLANAGAVEASEAR